LGITGPADSESEDPDEEHVMEDAIVAALKNGTKTIETLRKLVRGRNQRISDAVQKLTDVGTIKKVRGGWALSIDASVAAH
jgi:hypothetical protein